MAHLREKNGGGWTPVPQFGGWDQKSGSPDYSMVFTRARANRKQSKSEFNRASLGNEQELIPHPPGMSPPKKKRTLVRFFSCGAF